MPKWDYFILSRGKYFFKPLPSSSLTNSIIKFRTTITSHFKNFENDKNENRK